MSVKQFNKSTFPSIDTFRAIGVLFVFHYHCVYCFKGYENSIFAAYLQAASSVMWAGVNLFFIASGFINGPQIFKNQSIIGFASRRFARIYPLYFLFLLIGTIFAILPDKNPFFYSDNYNLVLPWLFLSGTDFIHQNLGPEYFSVSWSLSVEIQLYAITAFLMFCSKEFKTTVCLLLLAIGIILPYFFPNSFGHFGLIMHLDEFFIGVLLRQFYKNGFLTRLYKIKIHLIWVAIPFALVLYKPDNLWFSPLWDSILLIFFASLLLFLLNNPNLTCAPILTIGRNCYFIYLFHMFIFMTTDELNQLLGMPFTNRLILVELSFAVCVLLSIISMRFLEKPLKKWVLQLIKRKSIYD